MERMMTENYIELRVYLKDGVSASEAYEAASELQDAIIDVLDPSTGAPEVFTQDVTYSLHMDRTNMTKRKYERQFQMIFQAMKAGFITRERAQELVKILQDEFDGMR